MQIYNLLLEAALEAQQYGQKRLELTGAWQWLLTGFGETCITSLRLMNLVVQIYDLLLEAALEAQQCGPKRLELTGVWQWLLTEFGETYGIRSTYARLAHLRWIVRCWHMPHHKHRVCRHDGCCYGMAAGMLFKTDGY